MPKLDEYKWRYIILMFLVGTVGSWLVFGCIYTLIAHVSPACIADVANFSTAFLYAVEVQVTIGFGGRSAKSDCPIGIIMLVIHSVVGIFLHAFLLMVMLNKLSRPMLREKSLIFSDQVVMYKVGDTWEFKFRLGDLERSSLLLDCRYDVQMIIPEIDLDQGSQTILKTYKLKTTAYPDAKSNFFAWPTDIIHKMDSSSPVKIFGSMYGTELDKQMKPMTQESLAEVRHDSRIRNAGIPEDGSEREREVRQTLQNLDSSRLCVLFTAISNSNGQFISVAKTYVIEKDLKIGYNFEPMVSFNRTKNTDPENNTINDHIILNWRMFNAQYRVDDKNKRLNIFGAIGIGRKKMQKKSEMLSHIELQ